MEGKTTQRIALHTPQRFLIELAVHYLINQTDRIKFVSDPSNTDWRDPKFVSDVPRALVFLDLPPGSIFIPTAAEFDDGSIELVYNKLKSKDDRTSPPPYPERDLSQRKEYWQWFRENFSATKAMLAVEASGKAGRIRWIDYRLPLTEVGDTLHLHICPRAEYDTGVFAYNLVKRGFKHGLRLVGTLKSEPDMNVLAIYDK